MSTLLYTYNGYIYILKSIAYMFKKIAIFIIPIILLVTAVPYNSDLAFEAVAVFKPGFLFRVEPMSARL